jgi:integrase
MIEHAVWNTTSGPTKTVCSRGLIPVIPLLSELLTARRERLKDPQDSAYIFAGPRHGAPMQFRNLMNRKIKPALKGSAVKCAGLHAFRGGLGTNLFRTRREAGDGSGAPAAWCKHRNAALHQNSGHGDALGNNKAGRCDPRAFCGIRRDTSAARRPERHAETNRETQAKVVSHLASFMYFLFSMW